MLYWEKKLEMLLTLLKTFRMKEVNTMVDVYPCGGDMAKIKQHPFSIGQIDSNR